MSNKKQQEMVKARRQKVKDYVECHPNELLTSGQIALIFKVTSATIKEDMRHVGPTLGGKFEAIPRRGYRWTPTHKQEVQNHEGYCDPTAAAAIKNLDESAYIPFKEGAVHECQKSDGSYELIVIVKSFSGFSYYLVATAAKKNSKKISNELYTFFDIAGVTYYVDHRRVGSKPNKYVLQKVIDLDPEVLDHIQRSISSLFESEYTKAAREIELKEVADAKASEIAEQLRLEKLEKNIQDRAIKLDNLQHDLETQRKEFEAEKKRVKDIDQSFDNREALLDQREVDLCKVDEDLNAREVELQKREEEFEKSSAHVCIDEIDEWAAMVEENLNAREADLRQREAELDQALEMAELKVKVKVYERIIFGEQKSLKEQVISAPRTYTYNPKTDKENEELAKNILFNGPVNDVDEKYDATFFDPTTGRCFRSSLDKIKSAEAEITKQLTDLGYDDDNPWYTDPAAVKLVHEKYDEFFNRIAKEARV